MANPKCPKCGSKTIKSGFKLTKQGPKQRYQCKEKGHIFIADIKKVEESTVEGPCSNEEYCSNNPNSSIIEKPTRKQPNPGKKEPLSLFQIIQASQKRRSNQH